MVRGDVDSVRVSNEPMHCRDGPVIETYAHVTSKMRAVAPSRLAAMIDAPRRTADLADRM